jgi:DNA replication protein DnaC
MARLTAEQRRDLMEVIDDRHQRASTILATQIPIERWHDTIGDPTYADAILDRACPQCLPHRAAGRLDAPPQTGYAWG